MKIPGSITPIQPQLPVSHATDQAGAADRSVRFGAPSGLHPQDNAIVGPQGFAASFREPARLAARSDDRAVALERLKQQLGNQFGPDIAAKLFASKTGNPPSGSEMGSDRDLRFTP